jgi:hypothetical protein
VAVSPFLGYQQADDLPIFSHEVHRSHDVQLPLALLVDVAARGEWSVEAGSRILDKDVD